MGVTGCNHPPTHPPTHSPAVHGFGAGQVAQVRTLEGHLQADTRSYMLGHFTQDIYPQPRFFIISEHGYGLRSGHAHKTNGRDLR